MVGFGRLRPILRPQPLEPLSQNKPARISASVSSDTQRADELIAQWPQTEAGIADAASTIMQQTAAIAQFGSNTSHVLKDSFGTSFDGILTVASLLSGEFDAKADNTAFVTSVVTGLDNLVNMFSATQAVTDSNYDTISSHHEQIVDMRDRLLVQLDEKINDLNTGMTIVITNLQNSVSELTKDVIRDESMAIEYERQIAELAERRRKLVNNRRNYKAGIAIWKKLFGNDLSGIESALESNKQQLESRRRTLDDKKGNIVTQRSRTQALQAAVDSLGRATAGMPQQRERLSSSLGAAKTLLQEVLVVKVSVQGCKEGALRIKNKAVEAGIPHGSKAEIGKNLLEMLRHGLQVPHAGVREISKTIIEVLRNQDDMQGSISISSSKELEAARWELILQAAFDQLYWYRLTNKISSNVIDIHNDGGSNEQGHLKMTVSDDSSGQYWKLWANVDGTYSLCTMFLGNLRRLDARSENKSDAPHLALKVEDDPSQRWKFEAVGDGWYQARNQLLGPGWKLGTSVTANEIQMSMTENTANDLWSILPIREITETDFK